MEADVSIRVSCVLNSEEDEDNSVDWVVVIYS